MFPANNGSESYSSAAAETIKLQDDNRLQSFQIILDVSTSNNQNNNTNNNNNISLNNTKDCIRLNHLDESMSQRFPPTNAHLTERAEKYASRKLKSSETSVLIHGSNDDESNVNPKFEVIPLEERAKVLSRRRVSIKGATVTGSAGGTPVALVGGGLLGQQDGKESLYEGSRAAAPAMNIASSRNIGGGRSAMGMSQKKITAQSQNSNGVISVDLKLITMISKQVNSFFFSMTDSGRTRMLSNETVRMFLGDKSDFSAKVMEGLRYREIGMRFVAITASLLRRVPLIDSDSSLYFFVQFLYATYHTLFFMVFTLVNIFNAPSEYNTVLSQVTVVVWILEILLKINSSMSINEGGTVRNGNRNEIILKFIAQESFFDVLPLLFLIISPYQEFEIRTVMQLVVGLKMRNVWLLIEEFQRFLCMTFKDYYLIQLINLIIKLFIIGHIIACIWYLVGYSEINYFGAEATWFENGIGKDLTWWKLYLEALFWSLTLMTTGSNVATTEVQLFFTSFIMLFTTIIFGYILNVIGFVLAELDKKNESKRRDLNLINEYMRSQHTSKQLQKKINVDLEYFYEKNFKKIEEENNEILAKISNELNENLKKEYNRLIMNRIPVLKNNFSEKAIEELANIFEEVIFFPNQFIYQQEDSKDLSLMFITQGSVEITASRFESKRQHSKSLKILDKHAVFGEISFFTGLSRESSAKARDFTKLIKINREKFIEAIRSCVDKDTETFHAIKDKINIYSNYNDLNRQCLACAQRNHIVQDCPYVHQNRSAWSVKGNFEKTCDAQRRFVNRIAGKLQVPLHDIQMAVMAYKNDHMDPDELGIDEFDEYDERGTGNYASLYSENSSGECKEEDRDQIFMHNINNPDQKMVFSKQHSSNTELCMAESLFKDLKRKEESIMRMMNSGEGSVNNLSENPLSPVYVKPNIQLYNARGRYFNEAYPNHPSGLHASTVHVLQTKQQPEHMNDLDKWELPCLKLSNPEFHIEMSESVMRTKKKTIIQNQSLRRLPTAAVVQKRGLDEGVTREIPPPTVIEPIEEEIPGSVVVWELDRLCDFKHYFSSGNSRLVLARFLKFYKKKLKLALVNGRKSRRKL